MYNLGLGEIATQTPKNFLKFKVNEHMYNLITHRPQIYGDNEAYVFSKIIYIEYIFDKLYNLSEYGGLGWHDNYCAQTSIVYLDLRDKLHNLNYDYSHDVPDTTG